MNTDMIEL